MSVRVDILNGDVGPTLLPRHYNYRPVQRRRYADGLTMFVEQSPAVWDAVRREWTCRTVATVFIEADGLNGGWHRRVIHSPADIGALYVGFRRGLRQLGLYPLWDADGRRRAISDVRIPIRSNY